MPYLFYDAETRSAVNLKKTDAWRYASDESTQVFCVAYAVDAELAKLWKAGDPVPEEFIAAGTDPAWKVVAHNAEFEIAISQHILGPQFGFPNIPVERHICTMAMCLAAALPGALETVAEILKLSAQKDAAGKRLMLKLAKRGKHEPTLDELERLYAYCRQDIVVERAVAAQVPELSDSEQALWAAHLRIVARGFHIDRPLAEAVLEIAPKEITAINARINELTGGRIKTVGQVAKIKELLEERGHQVKSLNKRSVAALLAHNPADDMHELLELRREGGRASVRKVARLLASLGPDDRLRGSLRFHGSSTGRWSGQLYQPQNLKKPEIKDLDAARRALLARDTEQMRLLGSLLLVSADVSRSMICAPPGRILIGADFSAIESRILAWIAGEEWKLETYREYDLTGDPALEPYCVVGSKILHRKVIPEDEEGRSTGKVSDLACGFGGSVGAWRRFCPDDPRNDFEIKAAIVDPWRQAHPCTVDFWYALDSALIRAVRFPETQFTCGLFAAEVTNGILWVTLPSGRRLAYPDPQLVPGKFDGTTAIQYKDNAKGKWRDYAGWYGTFVENVVQGIARDLLAAALLRVEAAGFAVVLHVHDEIIIEADDENRAAEFLALMVTVPDWATGLPIAAKSWANQRYSKTKSAVEDIAVAAAIPVEKSGESAPAQSEPESAKPPEPNYPPLPDVIGEELFDGKIRCPFHNDNTPSLHIYDDHYYCFGCGARGDAIDWLMIVESKNRSEAEELLDNWQGRSIPRRQVDAGYRLKLALNLWEATEPANGLVRQYLADVRGIDADIVPFDALRFHPNCVFGASTVPCLVALYRDVENDTPAGIHRIALTPDVFAGAKVERRTLGRWPRPRAIKLWRSGPRLYVGEGIETTLAASTRIKHRGKPMRPAWAVGSSNGIRKLPLVAGVDVLGLLVDHDRNGEGQAAAACCAERWSRAGRDVSKLMPKEPGTDFNDTVMRMRWS